jgi:outer membrane protein
MYHLKWLMVAVMASLLPSVVTPAAAASDYKIGVVVTQQMLAGSNAGKAAFEKLKAKKEIAQEKLDKKAAELKEMEVDLQKRAMVLSGEEKKKAVEEFGRRQRDATRLKEDLERELQAEETEALGEVNRLLVKVIVEFGEETDFDLIIDAQAAVYFSEKIDVTEQILERANAQWKKGK